MRRGEKDVRLANGEGYMVEEVNYQQHLSQSLDIQDVGGKPENVNHDSLFPAQKSKCSNHRAIIQANSHSNHLEATGIGACACPRHGCFVPHSVVDFQKGER
jgi:hypothetical protein